MNKRETGARYEALAAAYLEKHGYRILTRNFRCRFGEIDLVAWDAQAQRQGLVFVEVKYRKNAASGFPEEALTQQKQQTISKVADFYLVRFRVRSGTPCRFDVLTFCGTQIRHIPNAFPYRGTAI